MSTSPWGRLLLGRYAKCITALAGAALEWSSQRYGATNQWVELAIMAAVATGVYAVPNIPPGPPPPG